MKRFALLALASFLVTAFAPQNTSGGVAISAAPAACAASASVQIWALTRNGQRLSGSSEALSMETWLSPEGGRLSIAVTFVAGKPTESVCRWTFDDLPAGQYMTTLVGPSGSGGSELFAVIPNRVAAVEIPAPQVELSGRILRDGTPVLTHLRIVPFPFSRPAIVVTSDEDGRYRATLDRPGLHRIEAVGIGLMESDLKAGPNSIDITLDQDGP